MTRGCSRVSPSDVLKSEVLFGSRRRGPSSSAWLAEALLLLLLGRVAGTVVPTLIAIADTSGVRARDQR